MALALPLQFMHVVSLSKRSSWLVSRRTTVHFTLLLPRGPGVQCTSVSGGPGALEEGENLWKLIHDSVRTPVRNVRLQTKVNAGTLISSGFFRWCSFIKLLWVRLGQRGAVIYTIWLCLSQHWITKQPWGFTALSNNNNPGTSGLMNIVWSKQEKSLIFQMYS